MYEGQACVRTCPSPHCSPEREPSSVLHSDPGVANAWVSADPSDGAARPRHGGADGEGGESCTRV